MTKFFKGLIFFALIGFGNHVMAQNNMSDLLIAESALRDSRKLIEGYMNPFMKSVGVGMANGWYNSAKTHKKFGVDLTATISAVRIPDKDLFYDIPGLNLENIELLTVNQEAATSAPTVFGPDVEVKYRFTNPDNNEIHDVIGPGGIALEEEFGHNFVPVPMLNLGVGLVKNTDLKIRFVPTVNSDDVTFNLWGVGVMHDVKQHLSGIKTLPFDLSGFVGYTSMDFVLDLSGNTAASGNNQKATLDANALTVQGIISKEFSVLTLYGGLGYNHVRTELNILGDYTVQNEAGESMTITDPLTNMGFPADGPRITAGMRLKLLILTLHADYTLQEYSTLTVGVGLSVN